MITRIRDLAPGDRFYLLRTMQRYTYMGRKKEAPAGTRHIVLRDGDSKTIDLHHASHVKRIVRADMTGSGIYCCRTCFRASGVSPFFNRMILCSTCGSKRCPKASDHRLGCTNRNEPGQPGSVCA